MRAHIHAHERRRTRGDGPCRRIDAEFLEVEPEIPKAVRRCGARRSAESDLPRAAEADRLTRRPGVEGQVILLDEHPAVLTRPVEDVDVWRLRMVLVFIDRHIEVIAEISG